MTPVLIFCDVDWIKKFFLGFPDWAKRSKALFTTFNNDKNPPNIQIYIQIYIVSNTLSVES